MRGRDGRRFDGVIFAAAEMAPAPSISKARPPRSDGRKTDPSRANRHRFISHRPTPMIYRKHIHNYDWIGFNDDPVEHSGTHILSTHLRTMKLYWDN